MRKFIICLIGAIILSNVQLSCKSVEAEDPTFWNNYNSWEDVNIKGMDYRIFYGDRYSQSSGAAIFVLNLTKDALEVEYLKKQLSK